MKGFREFSKDVNEKSTFPTFEQYKIQAGQGSNDNQKQYQSIKQKQSNKQIQERSYPEDGAQWEKYFENLKEKVKTQREQIKLHDELKAQDREKQYNQELHMKLVDQMNQQRLMLLQRSLATNTVQKTQRFYQKVQQDPQTLPNISKGSNRRQNYTSASPTRNLVLKQQREQAVKEQLNKTFEIDNQENRNINSDKDETVNLFLTNINETHHFNQQEHQPYVKKESAQRGNARHIHNQTQNHLNQGQEDQSEMFENYKLKDFLSQINKFQEKEKPIEIPGFGYNSCAYAKLVDEEKQVYNKNRKSLFTEKIFIEQQFLKSQSKARKTEHKLFEKLKGELEKQNQSDMDILKYSSPELQSSPDKQTSKKVEIVSQPLKNILKSISDMNKRGLEQNINGKKLHKYSISNINQYHNTSNLQQLDSAKTHHSKGSPSLIIANSANNTLSGGAIFGYQPQEKSLGTSTGRAFFNFNRSLMNEGKIPSRRQSNGQQ
eukprot:403372924